MALATSWPFVGRQHLLHRLAEAHAASGTHGALIVGGAGIGKTRLADEFAQQVRNERGATVRLTGSPGTNTIPYSAVAHLMQVGTFDTATTDPARVLAEVRQALGPTSALVIADDIGSIDDASIALLGHLLSLDAIFLVGTLRSGTPMSLALDALVRSYRFEHLHPEALTDAELVEAAEKFLGASLDPRSADRIGLMCGGNPLYLRELLLHGSAAGHITLWPSGFAWIEPDLSPSARLVELVEERFDGIDAGQSDLLRLIAVADEATMSDLVRLGELDNAVELERRGWLRVDPSRPDPVIQIAHPLHGEVLRTRMGTLDRRRQVLRAIDMMQSRPTAMADDALRIDMWRLDAGLPIDNGRVLLAGAKAAMAAFDLESTVRLATAVESVDPNPESQYLAMNALFLTGRFEDCIAIARRPVPPGADFVTLLSHTSVHLYALLWGRGTAEPAIVELERVRHRFDELGMGIVAEYLLGLLLTFDGRFEEAMERLGPSPDSPLMFLSAMQRSTFKIRMGAAASAREDADAARAYLEALPDPRAVMNPGFFALAQGAARSALGDGDEAIALMTDSHVSAREDRVTFLRSLLAVMLGEAHLWRGNLDEAEVWYLDALDAARSVSIDTLARIATAGLASIAGQRGDAEASARLLDEIDLFGSGLAFLLVEVDVGRAWAMHACGDRDGARTVLHRAAAEATTRKEYFGVARAAVEASRLGDHRWAADTMDALPPVDGRLVAAWRAFCAAFRGRTAERYALAHAAAVDVGASLLAAEAAAGWAEALRRDGDGRAASAASAASSRAVENSAGADTPLLAVASPVVLSRREREIGELAAEGLSNAEIAERLYLSRRTVENHLQRVYVKLGVANRQELRGAL